MNPSADLMEFHKLVYRTWYCEVFPPPDSLVDSVCLGPNICLIFSSLFWSLSNNPNHLKKNMFPPITCSGATPGPSEGNDMKSSEEDTEQNVLLTKCKQK